MTRVCLYDRAGLGGSDPNPSPVITSRESAADLDRALETAGLQGPFLIVGHSIGGLHAQVFASRYPSKVAGLVLVSSTYPGQSKIWLDLLPHPVDGELKAITDAAVGDERRSQAAIKAEEEAHFGIRLPG